MKDYPFTSDSYRMFAALSRICQSPVSWYSSGPAQKYILRQIKTIDESRMNWSGEHTKSSTHEDASGSTATRKLDVCLLMLYGHILFTSTSYTFAISMFESIVSSIASIMS
jgi:general transcription factor 3C polypeptide 3 (transcription factor C subunit 4)